MPLIRYLMKLGSVISSVVRGSVPWDGNGGCTLFTSPFLSSCSRACEKIRTDCWPGARSTGRLEMARSRGQGRAFPKVHRCRVEIVFATNKPPYPFLRPSGVNQLPRLHRGHVVSIPNSTFLPLRERGDRSWDRSSRLTPCPTSGRAASGTVWRRSSIALSCVPTSCSARRAPSPTWYPRLTPEKHGAEPLLRSIVSRTGSGCPMCAYCWR